MNHRYFIGITSSLLVMMASLFMMDFLSIMKSASLQEPYISHKDVKGVAVEYQKLLYTLNFEQQNEVLSVLNHATLLPKKSSTLDETRRNGNLQSRGGLPPIERLLIYPIEGEKPIILTPLGYRGKNLVFTAPDWIGPYDLLEESDGALTQLLSLSVDVLKNLKEASI